MEVLYTETCKSNEAPNVGVKTYLSNEHDKVQVFLKHPIGESEPAVSYRSLKVEKRHLVVRYRNSGVISI